MASINSVSLLSEAAFGCGMRLIQISSVFVFSYQADPRAEHLAATLTQGGQPTDQLKNSFTQTNSALSPIGDPPGSSFPQKSRLQSSALLRPKYICLSCSQSCVNSERNAHTEKTGHQFCMQARI